MQLLRDEDASTENVGVRPGQSRFRARLDLRIPAPESPASPAGKIQRSIHRFRCPHGKIENGDVLLRTGKSAQGKVREGSARTDGGRRVLKGQPRLEILLVEQMEHGRGEGEREFAAVPQRGKVLGHARACRGIFGAHAFIPQIRFVDIDVNGIL